MERASLDGDLFLQKIAHALLVEPEELLEVSEEGSRDRSLRNFRG
jgi:hypothetical protein